MQSYFEALRHDRIADAILVISTVVVAGLILGSMKLKGVRLGSAGVMFAGIAFAHTGARVDHEVLHFVRDFGLVLFVFMIGLQLGPGFLGAFRRQGLALNALAVTVVLLGTGLAICVGQMVGLTAAGQVGVLAGATTNTPSLGAAQQALASAPNPNPDDASLLGLGYAVAYPLGICGIIGSLVILRAVFRIDPVREAAELDAARSVQHEPVERRTYEVRNPSLDGVEIRNLPHIDEFGVQMARHRRAGSTEVTIAKAATELHVGDHLSAVGTRAELDHLQRVVGPSIDEDLTSAPADISFRRIIVTRKRVVGRALGDLHLGIRCGVKVTRAIRAGVDMAAFNALRLQYGDALHVLGTPEALDRAAEVLGNSPGTLNETQFMPIFLGIALGVVVGLVPIPMPGLPGPVRLGLAGGPLVVAIGLSRIGNIGPVVWYIPHNARLAFRELGITLFLAAVGLSAGESFFSVVVSERGAYWLGLAAVVALAPPVIVGAVARGVLRMNYATIAGVLSGSVTDPPALAFAGAACRSEAPYLAYATVYPATMLLRIVLAQVLVLSL